MKEGGELIDWGQTEASVQLLVEETGLTVRSDPTRRLNYGVPSLCYGEPQEDGRDIKLTLPLYRFVHFVSVVSAQVSQ